MDFFANTELSKATKELYNGRLRIIAGLTKTNNFRMLFTSPRKTIILIRSYLQDRDSYTSNNLASFIKSLMAYRKYHPAEFDGTDEAHNTWNVLLHQTSNQANDYREKGEVAPTQKNKEGSSLTMNDLQRKFEMLRDTDEEKLLMGFYMLIPPMRGDYGKVEVLRFGETPSGNNFIYLDNEKAVMQIGDYKTSKTNGAVRQVLPATLRNLLQQSLKVNPRKYVFGPYEDRYYSRWANKKLTELFGVPFTLVFFRHIYLNSLDMNQLTVEEKKKIAYLMGQTFNPNQQDLYRWV
jgi:hypothetical protein